MKDLRDETCDLKKAADIKVGDGVVESDGYVLTVTSVRHVGQRVFLGLRSARGPLNEASISKRKSVYVPKAAEE